MIRGYFISRISSAVRSIIIIIIVIAKFDLRPRAVYIGETGGVGIFACDVSRTPPRDKRPIRFTTCFLRGRGDTAVFVR